MPQSDNPGYRPLRIPTATDRVIVRDPDMRPLRSTPSDLIAAFGLPAYQRARRVNITRMLLTETNPKVADYLRSLLDEEGNDDD